MTRAAAVRQAEVTRALRAAKAAGMEPSACTISVDGSIQLQFADNEKVVSNSFDRLMANER